MELINTDRLYKVIGRFFTKKENCLLELIQNAQRSGAGHVEIKAPYKDRNVISTSDNQQKILYIRDDGHGIDDIISLLGIAYSNWDEKIDQQQPAGLGFLQLISLSERIYIHSKFGRLIINSEHFMQNRDYRQRVIEADLIPEPDFIGTEIFAEMKDNASSYLHYFHSRYQGFAMDITINDELITHIDYQYIKTELEKKKGFIIETTYSGNPLIISIDMGRVGIFSDMSGCLINWYGQYISDYTTLGMNLFYYYEVREHTPLTPRYPDRDALVNDKLYDKFISFIKRTVIKHLEEYFLNFDDDKDIGWLDYHCLLYLYENLSEVRLDKLGYIPAEPEYCEGLLSYPDYAIYKKSELKGYAYTIGALPVEGVLDIDADNPLNRSEYRLAGEFDKSPRVISVTEDVEHHLRKLGLKKLESISLYKSKDELPPTFTIGKLALKFFYEDGTCETHYLSEGVIGNSRHDYFICASDKSMLLGVFREYIETIISAEDIYYHETVNDAIELIRSEYEERFDIIDKYKFDFLPDWLKIAALKFDDDHIIIDYTDGRKTKLALGVL